MMHNARYRFALAAFLALVGCGGSHATDNAILPATTVSPKPASVRVNFKIVLPTPRTNALRRAPAYVSGSTQSVTVTVTPNGGSAATTTIGCTTTTCSGTVNAPVGSDTFAVTLYDGANGTGNALSTVTATQSILAGQANDVNLTGNGVVASLAVALGASATAGSSASIPLTVTALDPDGNTIVGPGNYVTSNGDPVTIALNDSDTSGATTLSQTSFTAPVSGSTLSYTGLAMLPTTLTASASGYPNATATFAPTLQPIVVSTPAAIDLTAASGAGSSGTVTASEVGWTDSPYNQSLTVTPDIGCASIGTVSQSGSTITATAVASPSAGTCNVTVSDPFGQSQAVALAYTGSGSSAFAYTGSVRSFTVPAGITSVTITAVGAGGGRSGGHGASETGTFSLPSGTTLDVIVGGNGQNGYSGGGGGGSFVFESSCTLLIAAGGGGGGAYRGSSGTNATLATTTGVGTAGGSGSGGSSGGGGSNGAGGGGGSNSSGYNGGGGGGTSGAGGAGSGTEIGSGGGAITDAGGAGGSGYSGANGGFGGGGGAGLAAGGGGGGYSGGGGGGSIGGGGGGGGSYDNGTNISTGTGAAAGANGSVTIAW